MARGLRPSHPGGLQQATRTKTYPGAQHEIFNETNREEVVADVIDFVDQALADGR